MNTIFPVASHTNQVGPGSTFVVIKGLNEDGSRYIPVAIKKGAKKVVLEHDVELDREMMQLIALHSVEVVRVLNSRKALAELSAHAAEYPARNLKIIGITGTKGKTTTSHLIFHGLQQAGISTALIGTVGNYINDRRYSPSLTTPQPDYLHQFLKECVAEGVQWVVMEVAAHAITLHRIEGIEFDCVMITNIAQEHLEFYPSMDAYASAKLALLSHRKPSAPAWLNADDERLKSLHGKDIYHYSLEDTADISGIYQDTQSFFIDCHYKDEQHIISCPSLMGRYNAYNLLAAVAGLQSTGISFSAISNLFSSFKGVPGRLEQYQLPNGAIGIIDYAHNPLSYQALLPALKKQTDQLIVVFGAGGDRDADRRPIMGALVAEYADLMLVTTDNPRSEDPVQIVEDILAGITQSNRSKVIIEPDRQKAIHVAYEKSHPGALIVLLGKGPDEYQLIGTSKIPFSERKILATLQ